MMKRIGESVDYVNDFATRAHISMKHLNLFKERDQLELGSIGVMETKKTGAIANCFKHIKRNMQ